MTLLALACACLGFAGLAVSMTQHHGALFGRAPTGRRRFMLRAAGWSILLLSCLPCLALWGPAIGIVGWFALLTIAAILTALGLTARALPRRKQRGRGYQAEVHGHEGVPLCEPGRRPEPGTAASERPPGPAASP